MCVSTSSGLPASNSLERASGYIEAVQLYPDNARMAHGGTEGELPNDRGWPLAVANLLNGISTLAWLDEPHGLLISITRHDEKWPVPPSNLLNAMVDRGGDAEDGCSGGKGDGHWRAASISPISRPRLPPRGPMEARRTVTPNARAVTAGSASRRAAISIRLGIVAAQRPTFQKLVSIAPRFGWHG
jgi:hypothetical protein